MLKERLAAVREVEAAFVPAELAAEDAFQLTVALLAAMNSARVSANLPLQTARTEFKHVTKAVQLAGDLREEILAAHTELAYTRSSVLPAFAVGDNGDCPGGTGTTKGQLRVAS